MAVSSTQRPHFESDGAAAVQDASSPAIASSSALARFEFEAGRGNEGTKILMVEWEDESTSGSHPGSWEVSWEGKSTVVPARDREEGRTHRMYFLLGAGAPVPPIVKIAQKGGSTMTANSLPAIFPPELGATARTAGKKGVLHTIWAKQRLSVLRNEIEAEARTNGESIGLEMAIKEKMWIEDNFGVSGADRKQTVDGIEPTSPTSPKAAPGGRLAEKLKGLKLGTSASDLQNKSADSFAVKESNPLSPDTGDVAVPSFSAFASPSTQPSFRSVAQGPPSHIIAQQGAGSRMNSLDAVTSGASLQQSDDADVEDELFAIKLSPRSPEMTKSPFSFTTKNTVPWLKEDN